MDGDAGSVNLAAVYFLLCLPPTFHTLPWRVWRGSGRHDARLPGPFVECLQGCYPRMLCCQDPFGLLYILQGAFGAKKKKEDKKEERGGGY